MTKTTPQPEPPALRNRQFRTSEGLRCLLRQLHEHDNDAWAHDPVAADLMQFVCDKYVSVTRQKPHPEPLMPNCIDSRRRPWRG